MRFDVVCLLTCAAFAGINNLGTAGEKVQRITDVALVKECVKNANAADAKYRGKTLVIEGTVFTTRPGILVLKGTSSKTGFDGKQLQCFVLRSEIRKASNLTSGQKVTIQGVFISGKKIAVLIDRAKIIAVGKDPALRVSSTILAKLYANTPKKADKTYKGKQVVVSGKIVESTALKEFGNNVAVVLVGVKDAAGKKLHVRAKMQVENQKRILATLQKNATITLKGECAGVRNGYVTIWYAKIIR